MEDFHSKTKKDSFTSASGNVKNTHEVNIVIDESGDDQESHCRRENVISDDFLANLLSKDSTTVSTNSRQQVNLLEPVLEAECSEVDIVVEFCKDKEKTCENSGHITNIYEQGIAKNFSDSNINWDKGKPEVEITNEIVNKKQFPTCSPEKKPSKSTSLDTFAKSGYRCESDSWTDDEDSSTSDSSSSDLDTFFEAMREKSAPKKLPVVKTNGELDLDELPLIEDLVISVNEEEMTLIGKVHAVVDKLVVIRAMKGMKALDLESVLFLSHDQPLGRVFDVFGPVNEPFYSVRFNSVDQITEKNIKEGVEVFFAPDKSDITSYVFLEDLQNQKGSDASWKHNNEPPEQFLDYSDDEKEKHARKQRMDRNRNRHISNSSSAPAKRPLLADDSAASNYIPSPKPPPRLKNNVQKVSSHFSRSPKPAPRLQNNFQEVSSNFSRSPKPAPRFQNNFQEVPSNFSRPFNPFQSPIPPQSPAPSVSSLMSPVRIQNYGGVSSPFETRRIVPQHQNVLYRPPSSPLILSPYSQPHIFGQVTVLNPLSPALHAQSQLHSPAVNSMSALHTQSQLHSPAMNSMPAFHIQSQLHSPAMNSMPAFHTQSQLHSPAMNSMPALHTQSQLHSPAMNSMPALHTQSQLHSPAMNSIPAMIPASHFSSPSPQNYFNQRFSRSPSPARVQQISPDPWLSNRGPDFARVPPSHPLTVQIPRINSHSFPVQRVSRDRGSVQQFANHMNSNFNESVVNNNRNFSSGNQQSQSYQR